MRRGPVWGGPVGYYSPEELKAMTASEISAVIDRDIYEDAYSFMEREPHPYRGRGLAEDMETGFYMCPVCGQTGTLHSRGDLVHCSCGFNSRYDEYGRLHGSAPAGKAAVHEPFTTARDWWLWQEAAMEQVVAAAGDDDICSDEGEVLYEVDAGSRSKPAAGGRLALGRKGLRCGSMGFPLEEIGELVITGQRTLGFSAGGKSYELQSKHPRSAAKYQRVFELLTKKPAAAKRAAELKQED
jgi:hypothetical protein